jgi:sensor domain CHASE-containing protein
MAVIEGRLVGALQGRIKEYVLQDLTCVKCKQVGHLAGQLSRAQMIAGTWNALPAF